MFCPKCLVNTDTEYELINPLNFETKIVKFNRLYDHIGDFYDTRHVKDFCNIEIDELVDEYYILRKLSDK